VTMRPFLALKRVMTMAELLARCLCRAHMER